MKTKTAPKPVAKKASKVAKKGLAKPPVAKKRAVPAKSAAVQKRKSRAEATSSTKETGIFAAVKREAAKMTAVAEAVVEVMQEELAKAKRARDKPAAKKRPTKKR